MQVKMTFDNRHHTCIKFTWFAQTFERFVEVHRSIKSTFRVSSAQILLQLLPWAISGMLLHHDGALIEVVKNTTLLYFTMRPRTTPLHNKVLLCQATSQVPSKSNRTKPAPDAVFPMACRGPEINVPRVLSPGCESQSPAGTWAAR